MNYISKSFLFVIYIFIFIFNFFVIFARSYSESFPFQNISLSWEERVEDLLSRLTLEEMVSQMAFGGGDAGPCPAIERLGIKPYNFNTECLRGVVAPNKATAFPVAIGMAATFSYEMLKNMAEIIGTEARGIYHDASGRGDYEHQKSISCLAPFINIMRHPLWGRVQEIYGEDPFLSGLLTSAYVRGLQGDHPRYIRANAGCKTLAAHSGPENIPSSRFSFDAKVSERDLRLTYLPHWKACIDAGSMNIMCSYNSFNGVPACGNKRLIQNIARKELGFKGYIISDWEAIRFIYTEHKYTKSLLEAVVVAINAGVDLELPGKDPAYKLLYEAVLKGLVSYRQILDSNRRLFYTRMRLGHFDPENLNPYSAIDSSMVQSPPHREAAIVSATKSFVLLKNNDETLPLKMFAYKTIAMIGPMSNNLEQLYGLYSPAIDERYGRTPYQGLNGSADKIILAPGCNDNACSKYDPFEVGNVTLKADFVIVCLGTGQQIEGEGRDRASLALPGYQELLLKHVISLAKRPVLLLVFSAGPVDIKFADGSEMVGAIMQCFLPAQGTGEALKRVLFVDGQEFFSDSSFLGSVTSPAGRLPYTWPLSLDQVPPMENYSMEGRTYRYFSGPGDPLYPFGYGLSYSKFFYKNLQTDFLNINQNDEGNITFTFNIYNMGPFDSDEVSQVYIRWNDIPVSMPQLQLVAVDRNFIKFEDDPFKIQLTININQLKIWDENNGFYLYPGDIDVYVGGQQPGQSKDVGSNILHTTIHVL